MEDTWDDVINCDSLNNSKISLDDKTKYDLYDHCIKYSKDFNTNLHKKNKKKNDDLNENINTYNQSKIKLDNLKENKVTLDEELINNKNITQFLVIENRIIFAVIILLIFLIYKYILK